MISDSTERLWISEALRWPKSFAGRASMYSWAQWCSCNFVYLSACWLTPKFLLGTSWEHQPLEDPGKGNDFLYSSSYGIHGVITDLGRTLTCPGKAHMKQFMVSSRKVSRLWRNISWISELKSQLGSMQFTSIIDSEQEHSRKSSSSNVGDRYVFHTTTICQFGLCSTVLHRAVCFWMIQWLSLILLMLSSNTSYTFTLWVVVPR